ncbi:hypothetical protein [Haloterrigena turkmenica]|uniref:hypothetical protein n=1 Tax=Haloterrigena turkmenica TaxID=62320 RepID=UPI0011D0F7B0|nr:hypothetical protein [Haloterrigena turkmenica]
MNVPSEVRSGTFPDLTDPIDIYLSLLVEVWTYGIVAAVLVPVVLGVLWGFSERFSRVRVWQAILVVTVGLAVAMSLESWGHPAAFVLATVGRLASGGAVLAAVVIVELLFAWDIASQTSLEGFVTASGGTLAVVVALVLVVATISTGVLAVAGTAGVSLPEESHDHGFGSASADELETEYSHYLDVKSGDELTCEPATVERENVPAAAQTHENDLNDFEVNATVYEGMGASIIYEWTYTGEGTLETQRSGTVENGAVELDGYWDRPVNEGNHEMPVIDGTAVADGGDSINGTYVEFDVVNDDGELIRYTGTLCDKNL